MDTGLLQGIIDVTFKGNLLYLAPIILLFMAVLFADRLVDLVSSSLTREHKRRSRG